MSLSRRHLVLGLAVTLAGCGGLRQSKLNPFNWFRKSEPRETIVLPEAKEDGRILAEVVMSLAVEPIPGGAIVRARGQMPVQGYWAAELVPLPLTEGGTQVYEFRVFPPKTKTDVNSPQSRQRQAAAVPQGRHTHESLPAPALSDRPILRVDPAPDPA